MPGVNVGRGVGSDTPKPDGGISSGTVVGVGITGILGVGVGFSQGAGVGIDGGIKSSLGCQNGPSSISSEVSMMGISEPVSESK